MTGRDIVTRLAGRRRKAHPPGAVRQSLPLHRLCRHRRRRSRARRPRPAKPASPAQSAGRGIGPVGSHPPAARTDYSQRPAASARAQPVAASAENFGAIDWQAVEREGVELRQSFSVPLPARPGLALLRRSRPGAQLHARRPADRSDDRQPRRRRGQREARADRQRVPRRARRGARRAALPRNRARRRPGRQEPVQRAGDHHLHVRSPTAAASQVDVSVKFLLTRRARAIQPLGARQGRRRPSDAGLCAKSRSPAVRQAARSPRAPRLSMPAPWRDRRSSAASRAFFRRLFGG